MPSIPGGVIGEYDELDSMAGSLDPLDEDASPELDVIVVAADERESQHSPDTLLRWQSLTRRLGTRTRRVDEEVLS